jgi:hypothetical protein
MVTRVDRSFIVANNRAGMRLSALYSIFDKNPVDTCGKVRHISMPLQASQKKGWTVR